MTKSLFDDILCQFRPLGAAAKSPDLSLSALPKSGDGKVQKFFRLEKLLKIPHLAF